MLALVGGDGFLRRDERAGQTQRLDQLLDGNVVRGKTLRNRRRSGLPAANTCFDEYLQRDGLAVAA